MGAFRNSLAPIPHDSLHSSPFYLQGPLAAATEKPPETRGHPGCNNESKNYPRAHKWRIKPSQALSFRYPWDSVSRSHQTLCRPLHPQCTNYPLWPKKPLSSLSIISFPPEYNKIYYFFLWWVNQFIEPKYPLWPVDPLKRPSSPGKTFPKTMPGTKSGHPHQNDTLSNGGIRGTDKKEKIKQ